MSPFTTAALTPQAIGALARARRKRLGLTSADLAGLAGTGNRFVVELEAGKPTLQLQKVLDVLQVLGIDLVAQPRTLLPGEEAAPPATAGLIHGLTSALLRLWDGESHCPASRDFTESRCHCALAKVLGRARCSRSSTALS